VPYIRQQRGQLGVIPSQGWPVLAFMDIGHVSSALIAVNIRGIHRKGNLISALFAANNHSIRRMIVDPSFRLEKRTPNDLSSVGLGSGRLRWITGETCRDRFLF
jgi:hypothetical protein